MESTKCLYELINQITNNVEKIRSLNKNKRINLFINNIHKNNLQIKAEFEKLLDSTQIANKIKLKTILLEKLKATNKSIKSELISQKPVETKLPLEYDNDDSKCLVIKNSFMEPIYIPEKIIHKFPLCWFKNDFLMKSKNKSFKSPYEIDLRCIENPFVVHEIFKIMILETMDHFNKWKYVLEYNTIESAKCFMNKYLIPIERYKHFFPIYVKIEPDQ